MSIKAMSYIWEHSKQKGSKLLMLLAIADRCDDYGVCYPGHKRLAEKARISTQSVSKNIKYLEKSGELAVIIHGGIKTTHGKTNKYYLKAYRDSLGLVTKDGNRSEYVTYDGVSKRIPQEVSNSIPQEVSNSIPYTSVDTSVDSSEKSLPPALSLDGDDCTGQCGDGCDCGEVTVNSKLPATNDTHPVEELAVMSTLDNMINSPYKLLISFAVWNKLILRGWAVEERSDGTTTLKPTDTGRAALAAWQDATTADLGAMSALTITEADAAIFGTRDNPVTPTEHIGALCEVDEDAPPKAKKAKKATYHQLLFGAISDALPGNPAERTKSAKGVIGRAVKELKPVNAQPEEMAMLFYYCNTRYDNPGAMCMVKYYAEFKASSEYNQLQAHLASGQDAPPSDVDDVDNADFEEPTAEAKAEAEQLLKELLNR